MAGLRPAGTGPKLASCHRCELPPSGPAYYVTPWRLRLPSSDGPLLRTQCYAGMMPAPPSELIAFFECTAKESRRDRSRSISESRSESGR